MKILIIVLGGVGLASFGWYAYCKATTALRVKLQLAKEVARKHETLLAAALPLVRNLVLIADKAGATNDALRFKTVENSIRFAIGMADKIKE